MSGKMPPNGVKKVLKSHPSTTSLYGTDIVSEELKTLVESISKHIIYGKYHFLISVTLISSCITRLRIFVNRSLRSNNFHKL